MDFKIVNPSDGRSCGVIILWKREVTVQQLFSAPNYIDIKILENDGREWRLTGMYGEPRWQDKYETWDKLRELNAQYDLPWVIIGDFNEIMFSVKKMVEILDRKGICRRSEIHFVTAILMIWVSLVTSILGSVAEYAKDWIVL
jgi:hypothetical protein